MKRIKTALQVTVFLCLVNGTLAQADEPKKARLDNSGRFWVYRNSNVGMFFLPYAFMPKEAGDMIEMHIDSAQNPHKEPAKKSSSQAEKSLGQKERRTPAKETCVSVKIKWLAPNWCGVAFISGPDAATPDDKPWWGEDDRGTHYDLRDLPKKRLVFWARSDEKATIQVKIGILGDKKKQPFGDSMKAPLESKWLTLKPEWTQYILDLSKINTEWLSAICNGFTFIVSQVQQEDPYAETTSFFLDDIYFE